MGQVVVGIGEAGVSKSSDDEIKTYALGSCVAVIMLDPKTRIGGMAHIALPDSTIDKERAERQPAYFADSGIPELLRLMRGLGSNPHSGYIVKIIGGANVIADQDLFAIGKRNVSAIKKILWDLSIPILAEDVGKDHSRTVKVEMKTGKVIVSSSDGKQWRV